MSDIRAIAILGALGAGLAVARRDALDGRDIFDAYDHDAYLKRRAEREAQQGEAQIRAERRRLDRQRARREAVERDEVSAAMLAEGLDPTNGRPLTRQQRRAREREQRK